MIHRPFWIRKIEQAWQKAPIAWLTGVRRVGKTTLAQYWKDAIFFNCDLPRNRKLLEDPEAVFQQIEQNIVILDEIHQTENPSEISGFAGNDALHPHSTPLPRRRSTRASRATQDLCLRHRLYCPFPRLAVAEADGLRRFTRTSGSRSTPSPFSYSNHSLLA